MKFTMSGLCASLLALAGCASTERMVRISPFDEGGLTDPDRVNLWPLYYQSGSRISILWPFLDFDEQGFSIRPLVSKDASSISLLGPLAGWNWKEDTWWVLPAYSLEEQSGLFPLFGFGKVDHVGPLIWDGDGDEEDDFLALIPLFLHSRVGQEHTLLTPLGGRGWSSAGKTRFVNILGPLFHHWRGEDESLTAVLWPLGVFHDEPERYHYRAYPFFVIDRSEEARSYQSLGGLLGYRVEGESSALRVLPLFAWSDLDSGFEFWDRLALLGRRRGEKSSEIFVLTSLGFHHEEDLETERSETSALAGLVGYDEESGAGSFRAVPLLAWIERKGGFEFPEQLTLFGYRAWEKGSSFHLLTPIGFSHEREGERTEWSGPLGSVSYESGKETSRFSLLWYLMRTERSGEEIHRDLFPFLVWDSGPELLRIALMYRLFHYERIGPGSRASLLFLPLWNDLGEEKDRERPSAGEIPDPPAIGIGH